MRVADIAEAWVGSAIDCGESGHGVITCVVSLGLINMFSAYAHM